jgi:hypothetical protein
MFIDDEVKHPAGYAPLELANLLSLDSINISSLRDGGEVEHETMRKEGVFYVLFLDASRTSFKYEHLRPQGQWATVPSL